MSRIGERFAELHRTGRRGFIPFITAGAPNLDTTGRLLLKLAENGADLIELGVPFSDPVADGEVIQRASERALRNGASLRAILDCVARVRRDLSIPIILFSYFNPLLQFGEERLADEAAAAGVDGVLVTDLIPEEAQSWSARLRASELDPIFLVAPTTSDQRLSRIAQEARGFLYAVARAGVTGARAILSADAETLVLRVSTRSDLPVAVGFGLSSGEQIREVWRFADAAVIGSAIVREIENAGRATDLVERVGNFVRALRATAEGHSDREA